MLAAAKCFCGDKHELRMWVTIPSLRSSVGVIRNWEKQEREVVVDP